MKYLIPFLVSFFLAIIFILILIKAGKKITWRPRKDKRHIHKEDVLRLGGVAMVISFLVAIFLNPDLFMSPEIIALLLGSVIFLIFGILDDVREIYWKIQLFFQLTTSIFVFIFGIRIYYITNPLKGGTIDLSGGIGVAVSVILVIFWILLLINSINWMDGIDGLSGGVSLIATLTIFFLSLKAEVFQPPVAIISAILSGSILAFLIFNFNPSKIMAGTSGAMFMGFAIAVLAIIAGTKVATALLVLAVPIIDLVWVIRERVKKGKSIFLADRSHLHYKLLELGWSQRKIAFLYWGLTSLVAIIALNTRAVGKGITLLSATIVMVATYILIDKKIGENKKV
jgi:UDP-GlcNAc:undecaprenyl-phosphate/decaprenyl-phosphate GlcNAc-1-phosphate transferase